MRRLGFTLIELTAALAVTGIVALIVYGTVAVAVDTEREIVSTEEALRSHVAWRVIVHDALRNLRTSDEYDGATFTIEPGTNATGASRDLVTFVTAGGTPPLTPDVDWRVTVRVDGVGLRLTATALAPDGLPPVDLRWPAVIGIDVRALGDGGWQEMWRRDALPRAVRIGTQASTEPSGLPLIVTLPERGR